MHSYILTPHEKWKRVVRKKKDKKKMKKTFYYIDLLCYIFLWTYSLRTPKKWVIQGKLKRSEH